MNKRRLKSISALIIGAMIILPFLSIAQTVDDLQKQINDKQAQIKELEKQIAAYQEQIKNHKAKESTLAKQISYLQTQIKQLEAEIKLTQTKISSTSLKIKQLSDEIDTKNLQITQQKNNISETIRTIYQYDQETPLGLILKNATFSDFLNQAQAVEALEIGLKEKLDTLNILRAQLESQKSDLLDQKSQLESLRDELAGKNAALADQKDEKNELLITTKNQEKKYQQMLSALQKQQQQIQKEIVNLEKKLRQLINPNSIPGRGLGIFIRPVPSVITQGYGPTSQTGFINDAYEFHNGIDFAAKIGDPVKAAADGVVVAIGNDGKYAYGKWLAIDHQNGLTTLYAHFSGYAVSVGQKVKQGQIIGYAGNTGFSTGPHVHFTVYATNTFSTNQRWYGLLPLGGSINPLDYL